MPKACCLCPAPAEYVLRFHLSTIGRTPRQQKSLSGIALCSDCLARVTVQLAECAPAELIAPLRAAHFQRAEAMASPDLNAITDTEQEHL